MKPRALIVGDRRKPGVEEGVQRALPFLRSRLEVAGVDLDDRLTLSKERADLVLVFGGDGSFLYVANRLGTNPIPVLGVNFGRLGWLAELQPEGLEEGIEAYVQGKFQVTERARLRCTHRLGGRVVDEGLALNDVVVGRRTLGRMIELDVRVDGQGAITVAGDGLIVATASGSTAHALAAGGPLVAPSLPAIVLAPICPHALGTRPLVLPQSSRIELVVRGDRAAAAVTVDGREPRALERDETIEVVDARAPLRLVSVSGRSYYDLLRAKLGWKGRPEYRGEAPGPEPGPEPSAAPPPAPPRARKKASPRPRKGRRRA